MKLKYKIIWIALSFAIFAGCNESDADKNGPSGSTTVPQQVTDVTVNNFAGGSVIKYKLPDDLNMKYLKAVYSTKAGEEHTVNASYHVDSVVVEGFPESKEYDVKLYSVSYGEAASAPVSIKIHPQTPPYQAISESLDPNIYFGGLRVDFDGNDKNNSVAMRFIKKINSVWSEVDTYYTSSKKGDFYLFNQESVETDFGIFVTDRWGNISDTTYISGTPWFEEECNKNLFKHKALPTDTYIAHTYGGASVNNNITALWDGRTDGTEPIFHSKPNTGIPQWFTIDLGKEYNLSRFIEHSRTANNAFKNGHPKEFELWGSLDPNPDGSFDDSWYLILGYVSVKPSGNAPGATTDEDKELVKNGEMFLIPPGSPSARYIRFKTTKVWTPGISYIFMSELTFFGATVEE